MKSRDDDVNRNNYSDNSINNIKSRIFYHNKRKQNSSIGIKIRSIMERIRFYHDISCFFINSVKISNESKSHNNRKNHHINRWSDKSYFFTTDDFHNGFIHNEQPRNRDNKSFQKRSKSLHLPSSVVEIFIRWFLSIFYSNEIKK